MSKPSRILTGEPPKYEGYGRPGCRLNRPSMIRFAELNEKHRSPMSAPPSGSNVVSLRNTESKATNKSTPPMPTKNKEDLLFQIRERVQDIIAQDPRVTQALVCRETKISSSQMSQFLGGKYKGDNEGTAQVLQRWLNAYDERNQTQGLPSAPTWIETPTSRRILSGLRYAQMANDIVLIYGGAGVGKTQTIAHYGSIAPNVWHIEVTPATATVRGVLEEIANVLGIKEYIRVGASLHRVCLNAVRNSNGLLVVDEAQHLTVAALDQIRAFNDQGNIGIVLSGNERVDARMRGGAQEMWLDRLRSRVGKRVHIARSLPTDSDALMHGWGIADAECLDKGRKIAAKPGGLRLLTKSLRLGATFAAAEGRKLCCEDLQRAATDLDIL